MTEAPELPAPISALVGPVIRDLARRSNYDVTRSLHQVDRLRGCTHPIRLTGHAPPSTPHTGEILHNYTTATSPRPTAGPLRQPPRHPLPRLLRTYRRRHLPPHPRRTTRRQDRPGHRPHAPARVRHPHRPRLRPRPQPARHAAAATAAPAPPPPATTPSSAHRSTPTLRLHRRSPVERPRRRPVAPLHHLPAPARSPSAAGLTQQASTNTPALSFAKVAEYQKRGVVHFHAVIRLDGPDRPRSHPARLGHRRAPRPRRSTPPPRHARRLHRARPRHSPTAHSPGATRSTSARSAPRPTHGDALTDRPSPPTSPSTPPKAPRPPAPSTAASAPRRTRTHDITDHARPPDPTAWHLATHPSRPPTSACANGPTCSASEATSPPAAATTPPPSAIYAKPASTGPAHACRTTRKPPSSSPTGSTPDRASHPANPLWPPQPTKEASVADDVQLYRVPDAMLSSTMSRRLAISGHAPGRLRSVKQAAAT